MAEHRKFNEERRKRVLQDATILIAIFLLPFLPAISPGMFAAPGVLHSHPENQEKESQIDHAEIWNKKGKALYEKKDYESAIECFREAVKLGPAKVDYFINLAAAYRDDKKFAQAEQLLKEAIKKFPKKESQKKLKIAFADVHFRWGENLRKKCDYVNAIKHYKISYVIDKIYRPPESASDLNNIGFVYDSLGRKHKALLYYENALSTWQAVGDLAGEARTLANIGRVYSALGQKHKALEYQEKALQTGQAAGDLSLVSTTLNNIGEVYNDFGQKQKALVYFEKALFISRLVKDPSDEIVSLNNIGLMYSLLGQKSKALEYLKKAFRINQLVGDRSSQATILNSIGTVYSSLGQKHKALEYLENALQIIQAAGDRELTGTILNNIGEIYNDFNQKHKALKYFEKALIIWQEVGNRGSEAATLSHIGSVYDDLGQKQKTLECYEKALAILQSVGDIDGKANILNNIGLLFLDLGQKHKALECYEKALTIWQSLEDRTEEANTLNNIGGVYSELAQNKKALEYYEKALPIRQELGDRAGEAVTLNNIGIVHLKRGETKEALKYFEKALPLRESVGDRAGEAATINNIGLVYDNLGENQKALGYYEKALPLIQTVGRGSGEAIVFYNLMICFYKLKNPTLAAYYGKQSVNIFQNIRANISNLDKEIKKSYIENNKEVYRQLVGLLITKGRLLEAQQVLDMLKEQEFFDFIGRDSSIADSLSAAVDFTRFEKQWIEKYNTAMEKLANVNNNHHVLRLKKNRSNVEEKRLKELESKLKEETRVYEDFMARMKEAFARHEKEIKEGKIATDVLAKEASMLQETLKYLDENEGGKHAALHYLVYEGRISVILTTPDWQLVKQTEIDEKEFYLSITAYRNFMINTGRGAIPIDKTHDTGKDRIKGYEKQFYDLIFKTVDEELKKYGATNLVVSLDSVLRYLPLGSLWDGQSYLLQRYRIAILTPSSLKNIGGKPIKEKKILGLGASQGGQGFPPLPNVPTEIRLIVKDEEKRYNGLIRGKAFIDDDFTRDTMVNQLKANHYPLVHIASHFKFSPGDETKNYLLLGDGTTMKLSEIRRMGKLFDKVHLLVLSACQTGVGGNGEEIDGFGELAQLSGAKSVVASLWPVADESTRDLMVTFYEILKEGKVTSKIEALRQAQLELAGLEDLLQKGKNTTGKVSLKKTKYAHPYYWGPFIMMGNWR